MVGRELEEHRQEDLAENTSADFVGGLRSEDVLAVITSQLSCDQLDMLVYAATGMSPNTLLKTTGCKTRGALRRQCRARFRSVSERNPHRLQMLAEDFSNLPSIVMNLGYKVEDLSDLYKGMYGASQQVRQHMRGMIGGHDTYMPPAGFDSSGRPSMPQLPSVDVLVRPALVPRVAITNEVPQKSVVVTPQIVEVPQEQPVANSDEKSQQGDGGNREVTTRPEASTQRKVRAGLPPLKLPCKATVAAMRGSKQSKAAAPASASGLDASDDGSASE